jgi:mannosyltransferase OCH1-like enzyme
LKIDLLKPMILYHFGGLYLEIDFVYLNSFKFLHRVMDLYTGFEGMNWPGVAPGIIAARPLH